MVSKPRQIPPFNLEGWGRNAKGNPRKRQRLSNGEVISTTLFELQGLVRYCVYFREESTFSVGGFIGWDYAAIAAEKIVKGRIGHSNLTLIPGEEGHVY